jgi:hypothetical protein
MALGVVRHWQSSLSQQASPNLLQEVVILIGIREAQVVHAVDLKFPAL